MPAVGFNQEAEKDHYDLFENMLTGIIVLEVIYDASGKPVDHRLLRANAQFEVQTGLKREEEVGKTSEHLSFKWPDEVRQEYYSIAKRGGSLYWERYNESLKAYYDARVFSPKKGQFAVMFYDITKRKLAEKTLAESEELNRLLFNTILDGALFTAPDGKIFAANPSACNIFQRTEDEIRHVGRNGLVDLSDPRLAMAIEERERTGRFFGELTLVRKDGTKFPGEVSSAVFKDKDGNVRTSMTIRDITERTQNEEALRRSEERLRMAQAVAKIGSWEHDLVTNVMTWSDEIFHIFEIDQEHVDASYEEFLAVIHPEDKDKVNRAHIDSLENKFPFDIEHRLLFQDSRVKYIHERCEALFDQNGKALRLIGTAQDITERKRLKLEGTELLRRIESLILQDERPAQRIAAADRRARTDEQAKRLSNRHRDVLQLIAMGLTSAEIAARLNISQATVITHRRNIMRKLGLHSAAELTAYTIKNRIVS
jgi:PAS domain S-box-containing protein